MFFSKSKPFAHAVVDANHKYVPNGLGISDKRSDEIIKLAMDALKNGGGVILKSMEIITKEVNDTGELMFAIYILGSAKKEMEHKIDDMPEEFEEFLDAISNGEPCPGCGEVHDVPEGLEEIIKKGSGKAKHKHGGVVAIDASDPRKRQQVEAIIKMLEMLADDKDPMLEELKRKAAEGKPDSIN